MFRKMGNARGQSLVETALILPVLLLVLTGIIDFGLLFNNYLVASNAAREAARSAAVGASDYDVVSIVHNTASSLDPESLSISIEPLEANRKRGEQVTVTIVYEHDIITPIISAIIPNPMNVTVKSAMRIE